MTPLKLLLILCTGDDAGKVRQLIDEHHVHGFIEITGLRGSGETGRHMGTRAFPGTASLVFTAVPAEKSAPLIAALRQLDERRRHARGGNRAPSMRYTLAEAKTWGRRTRRTSCSRGTLSTCSASDKSLATGSSGPLATQTGPRRTRAIAPFGTRCAPSRSVAI